MAVTQTKQNTSAAGRQTYGILPDRCASTLPPHSYIRLQLILEAAAGPEHPLPNFQLNWLAAVCTDGRLVHFGQSFYDYQIVSSAQVRLKKELLIAFTFSTIFVVVFGFFLVKQHPNFVWNTVLPPETHKTACWLPYSHLNRKAFV